MPGSNRLQVGRTEPPLSPPCLALSLGINCGLLKCFLIEILPNFTLGDQVQPARSYANTLTLWLWRPAPSRERRGRVQSSQQ